MKKVLKIAIASVGLSAAVMYVIGKTDYRFKRDEVISKVKETVLKEYNEKIEELKNNYSKFQKELEEKYSKQAEEERNNFQEEISRVTSETEILKQMMDESEKARADLEVHHNKELEEAKEALTKAHEEELRKIEKEYREKIESVEDEKKTEEKIKDLSEQYTQELPPIPDVPVVDKKIDAEVDILKPNLDKRDEEQKSFVVADIPTEFTKVESVEEAEIKEKSIANDISLDEYEEKRNMADELFKKPKGKIKIYSYQSQEDAANGKRFDYQIAFDRMVKNEIEITFEDSQGNKTNGTLNVNNGSVFFNLGANETMVLEDVPENTIFTIKQTPVEPFVTKATRMTSADLEKALKKVKAELMSEPDAQDEVIKYFKKTKKLIDRCELQNLVVKEADVPDTYLFVNETPNGEEEKKTFKERMSGIFKERNEDLF